MDPLCPNEGWWGGWVTLNLSASVTNGAAYVVTPMEIARLTDLAACTTPIHIRNGFYEYLKFGRGLQPKHCQGTGCGSTFQAFERDNVVTFSPLVGSAQTLRIYPTDARDSGLRVLLQGKDNNGQVILTTDPGTGLSAPGEYVPITFPFANSVNLYSAITGIQKDQTFGPVQLFQVDAAGNESALSTMNPNEAVANYRRYLINGVPNTNLCCTGPGQPVTLTAQGRIEFQPVYNETDYLTLQCVPALTEEAMSIRYGRMDNGGNQAMAHHARAIALLNGQLDLYEGKTSTAVKVPIFGSNRLRPSSV